MKPKNFPGKKLRRKLVAQGINKDEIEFLVAQARQARTKKSRQKAGAK